MKYSNIPLVIPSKELSDMLRYYFTEYYSRISYYAIKQYENKTYLLDKLFKPIYAIDLTTGALTSCDETTEKHEKEVSAYFNNWVSETYDEFMKLLKEHRLKFKDLKA